MDGIVPLFKERGMTSAACVARCRGIFQTRRVGHSGTLDPNVDGVLPVCIGKATKLVNYLMASGKIYQGEITLGFATETEDLDGAEIARQPLTRPFTTTEIVAAMEQLVGDIVQIPPMYSAVKVKGKRLYEYARAGEKVERPKRLIHVDYFKQRQVATFDSQTGLQKIYFEVGCGKGTYVRTLAVDLGKILGVPAVMSDLTRLKSGGITVGQTLTLDQLQQAKDQDKLDQVLLPVATALRDLPAVAVTSDQWRIVKNGGFLALPEYQDKTKVTLTYHGKVRCVYQYDTQRQFFRPETMIDLSE